MFNCYNICQEYEFIVYPYTGFSLIYSHLSQIFIIARESEVPQFLSRSTICVVVIYIHNIFLTVVVGALCVVQLML